LGKYFLLYTLFFAQSFTANKCDLHLHDGLQNRVSPPTWEKFIYSKSGDFIIYYDTIGVDAPDTTDLNGNNISDYIDNVVHSIDSIKYVLCDLMGYKSVPTYGENPYPIYISNRTSGSYGINYGAGNSIEAPNGWVEIDNDYSTGFYTDGLTAMQVTLAHEYFHAVQRKYREITGQNMQTLRFFYEFSSTWIEEIIYPNHDDYIYWVDDFFNNPIIPIEETDGYSIALLGHYINVMIENTEGLNGSFNRFVWEMLEDNYNPPRFYMNQILEEDYNTSFMEIWADFIALNYFNGSESSLHFYSDQINMDKISSPNPVGLYSFYSEILPVNPESVTLSSVKTNLAGALNINHNSIPFGKIVKLGSEELVLNASRDLIISMQGDDELKLVYFGQSLDEITIDYDLDRTPTTPSNLNAIENNGTIDLDWNPSLNSGDSLKYYIFRNNILINYSDSNFYKDEDVENYTSYFYEVQAWNENGYSGKSNGINMILFKENKPFKENSIVNIYPNVVTNNNELFIIIDSNNLISKVNVKLFNINGDLINQFYVNNSVKGRQILSLYGLIPSYISSGLYFINFCFDGTNCSNHKITWLK